MESREQCLGNMCRICGNRAQTKEQKRRVHPRNLKSMGYRSWTSTVLTFLRTVLSSIHRLPATNVTDGF